MIRKHKSTGRTTFFGNVTSAYGRSKYHGATAPPYLGDDGSYHPLPTYGDGSPIENKYLDLALSLAESSQVLVNWQEGDIVLLDVCPHPFPAILNELVFMLTVLHRIMQLCTLGLHGRVRGLSWQLYGMKMEELMTLRKERRY